MATPVCLSCRALYPDEATGGLPAACPRCGGFWGFVEEIGGLPRKPPGERPTGRGPFPLGDDGVVAFHEGRAGSEPPSRGGGTFKERGAEALAAVCARRGLAQVFLDSSGNAGIAMARSCSARGIRCRVLVPETTPEEKLRALRAAGADLSVIPGDRQAAADAAAELRQHLPYASHVYQPFFLLGVATLGWEIAEAIQGGVPIDRIVLPAGNGSLLLGLALGLEGWLATGLPDADNRPALHAVQLAGYAALAEAFGADPGIRAPGGPTAAGIAVAEPPRREEMIEAIRKSGGTVTVVTEEEIAAARRELAAAGHPTDPTGAAAWAGLAKRPDLRRPGTAVILSSRDAG